MVGVCVIAWLVTRHTFPVFLGVTSYSGSGAFKVMSAEWMGVLWCLPLEVFEAASVWMRLSARECKPRECVSVQCTVFLSYCVLLSCLPGNMTQKFLLIFISNIFPQSFFTFKAIKVFFFFSCRQLNPVKNGSTFWIGDWRQYMGDS